MLVDKQKGLLSIVSQIEAVYCRLEEWFSCQSRPQCSPNRSLSSLILPSKIPIVILTTEVAEEQHRMQVGSTWREQLYHHQGHASRPADGSGARRGRPRGRKRSRRSRLRLVWFSRRHGLLALVLQVAEAFAAYHERFTRHDEAEKRSDGSETWNTRSRRRKNAQSPSNADWFNGGRSVLWLRRFVVNGKGSRSPAASTTVDLVMPGTQLKKTLG